MGILDQITANVKAQFDPPKPQPFAKPIDRNIVDLGTGQIMLGTVPIQIVGVRPERVGVMVTNLSGVSVYLGSNANVSPTNGDLLAPGIGQWKAYATKAVLWGVVASGSANVSWAEIFDDD